MTLGRILRNCTLHHSVTWYFFCLENKSFESSAAEVAVAVAVEEAEAEAAGGWRRLHLERRLGIGRDEEEQPGEHDGDPREEGEELPPRQRGELLEVNAARDGGEHDVARLQRGEE